MAKNSIEAYKAEGKTNLLLFKPEALTLVKDVASALYDERVEMELDEALVRNIMEFGVIEPVVVWKNPETSNVEIVDGRQRVRAAIEANKRLKKAGCDPHMVPSIAKRATEAHTRAGIMVSTFIRQDDTPMGKAKKLARYLDLGRSEEQAAVTFGISKSSVKNLLSLLETPKAVQKAVQNGTVAASVAYELAKLPAEEQKVKLAEVIAEAPKAKGRKRSANGKKAREIATGKSDGKGKRELLAMIKQLEGGEDKMKEMHRAGALAALMFALGDEAPLAALMA